MSFPLTVTCISLLCGTNNLSSHSPATISATEMEILFVLRQKCPTCVIHLFPNLPRFDQFFSNVRATNTYIYFHVKNFFPDVLLHDLPSSLYNRNVYRKDKLHLTKKGNAFLPNGSTTAFPMPVLQLIPLSTLPLQILQAMMRTGLLYLNPAPNQILLHQFPAP